MNQLEQNIAQAIEKHGDSATVTATGLKLKRPNGSVETLISWPASLAPVGIEKPHREPDPVEAEPPKEDEVKVEEPVKEPEVEVVPEPTPEPAPAEKKKPGPKPKAA